MELLQQESEDALSGNRRKSSQVTPEKKKKRHKPSNFCEDYHSKRRR